MDLTKLRGRAIKVTKERTCSRCGSTKPVREFSGRRADCKTCAGSHYVHCGCGCGLHLEKKMEIYSVRQDPRGYPGLGTYYINQKHKDRADGAVRDSEGFITRNKNIAKNPQNIFDKPGFGR